MKNYYQILTVEKFTSVAEVKRAYRRLAFQYHPDHNPENKGAEERFKEINEAYVVLSNMESKRCYDLLLQSYLSGEATQIASMRRPSMRATARYPRPSAYTAPVDPDDEQLERWLPGHIRIFGGFGVLYLTFFVTALVRISSSVGVFAWAGIEYALTYALLLSVLSFMILTPVFILLFHVYKKVKPSMLLTARRMKTMWHRVLKNKN